MGYTDNMSPEMKQRIVQELVPGKQISWHISLPIRIRFFTPSWVLIRRWTTQERPLGS